MKTVYVSCESDASVLPTLKKSLDAFSDYERIGLLASAQHLEALKEAEDFLKKKKKNPVFGGQILGCNINNAEKTAKKVDAFLFIGSGRFHALALAKLGKPVLILNPYRESIEEVSEKEKADYEKNRKARTMKAAEAESFGILVSTKTGQQNLRKAEKLKKLIEKNRKKAFIFAGTEINPSRLLGYRIDAWVNTACPRIAEDEFEKPVLNPEELRMLL